MSRSKLIRIGIAVILAIIVLIVVRTHLAAGHGEVVLGATPEAQMTLGAMRYHYEGDERLPLLYLRSVNHFALKLVLWS
jgi:hypothetical protein